MRSIRNLLGALFVAPLFLSLVYAEGLLYPFVTPKTLLFRGLGVVVLATLLYYILRSGSLYIERLRQPTAWIPGALLVLAYIASFVGVHFFHSFWSTFDRGDGLITFTVANIFFYAILLVADRDFMFRLIRVSVWVGGVVALYALLQSLQTMGGFDIPLIAEARGRVGGTFGNAAFLSSFLGMTLALTLGAALLVYRAKWQWAAYASAALQLLAILAAATRGTLLALVVIGFFAGVFAAFRAVGIVRTFARAGLIIALVFTGLFMGFRAQLQESPIEPLRRVARISLSDETVASRLFILENVGKASLEHPLLGVGAEHVEVVFNKVYNPDEIREEWFDRSHNAYLDYFVQYGILGVLLYMAIIALSMLRAWSVAREGETMAYFVLAALGMYAVQNLAVFDTALSLWLFLTLCAGILTLDMRHKAVPLMTRTIPHYVPSVGVALLLLLLIPISLQPLRANVLLASAYTEHVADVDASVEYLHKGLALNTYADLEYGYQVYSMYANEQAVMLAGTPRYKAYMNALATLSHNTEIYPYDARTAVYLAHVLDLTPPEAELDEMKLHRVIDTAIALSPNRLQPWYLRANISIRKGDAAKLKNEKAQYYKEGIAIIEEYGKRQPLNADPRYIIANLYLAMGDRVQAEMWANEGERLYRGRLETAQRAVKYYINSENWPMATRFLTDVVAENPTAYELQYDLAKVTFLSGDKEGAKRIVEELRLISPQLIDTDPAFVKAISEE